MTNEIAESIAASLVREYLSRKGLKTTLQVLDEELPRDADSISNRQQLVKELHIEKIMKKNKEQSQPLKAMLEVITQSLLTSRPSSSMKNGDLGPVATKKGPSNGDLGQTTTKQGPSVTMETNNPRSGLRSSYSSKSQYPTVEDTDHRFDGFPTSQQTDDDDLLKPDPNFSYPSQKVKPKPAASSFAKKPENKAKTKGNNSDLVIEDSVEGETILGDGKAGVMSLEEEEDQLPTRSLQSRPRSTNKPRSVGLGMSGPIINTEETGRRKFNKPRPMSASKNQRLNIFENETPKLNLDSINPASAKTAPTPTVIHSKPLPPTESVKAAQNFNFRSLNSESDSTVKEIETLISGEKKKSIQDVLDIEKEPRPHTATRRQSSIEKETQHYSVDKSSIAAKGRKPGLGSQNTSSNSLKVGDLEMGDVDNLDDDLAKLDLAPRVTSAKVNNKNQYNSKPIDVKTAVALKQLIFGNPMASFNDEWKFQSFSFCDMPKLKYGIVQKKGGACGVLASVQACVLQELLFGEKKIPAQRFNEPTYEERTEALSAALAKIFWRCGEKRKAVVCLPSSRPVIGSGGKFKADEFIETLSLYTFIDFEELSSFMKQVVSQFELDGQGGVVLSLYSAILSRKVEGVKDDMDVPTNALMGAHGYCTQEMVNLYLSGRAVSNVFNDVMELDSGDGNIMMLKGVVSRCDVGLLSLFEHYKSCQVGTYMKTPRYPIWVICSESHFSVLFCVRKELTSDWKAERRFDLYYYDGLARQQEEIRLTIDTNNRAFVPPSDEELVPPIDHCIRTKWEGAEVDWNGTEPLL